jgi:hypothetical protein
MFSTMFTQPTPATGPARMWPSATRRRAGAVSLVGMFATLTVSTLTDPLSANHDNATDLRDAAGHLGSLQASSMLELLAAMFAIGAIAAFLGVVRQRGAGLANAAAVIGIPGCIGMAAIGVHGLFLHALVSSHAPNGLQILDQLDNAAGPVQILFFGMPVASVLMVAAAVRARIVPKLTLVLAAIFFIIDSIRGIPGGELVALVTGLITFGWIAWRIARLTEPATAPSPASELRTAPSPAPERAASAPN